MRLLRIIMEGLLVAFLAALGVYLFRDHIVFGLVVGTLVCGWGLTSIALIEHTQGHHKRGASPPKPEARIPSIDADRPTYQPSHHVLGNGEVRLIIANLRELPMEATCIVGDRDGPDSSAVAGAVAMPDPWYAGRSIEIDYPTEFPPGGPALAIGVSYDALWSIKLPSRHPSQPIEVDYMFTYEGARPSGERPHS